MPRDSRQRSRERIDQLVRREGWTVAKRVARLKRWHSMAQNRNQWNLAEDLAFVVERLGAPRPPDFHARKLLDKARRRRREIRSAYKDGRLKRSPAQARAYRRFLDRKRGLPAPDRHRMSEEKMSKSGRYMRVRRDVENVYLKAHPDVVRWQLSTRRMPDGSYVAKPRSEWVLSPKGTDSVPLGE